MPHPSAARRDRSGNFGGGRDRREGAAVLINVQNLFHGAKECFGRRGPDFDPIALAQLACNQMGWRLEEVRLYTGAPHADVSPFWHAYWERRLSGLGRRGVRVWSRPLKMRERLVQDPDGSVRRAWVPQEKGTDVRIAIDMVRIAMEGGRARNIVLFSEDHDLREAVEEVVAFSQGAGRPAAVACAFPDEGTRFGIRGTRWVRIGRADYMACLDPEHERSVAAARRAVDAAAAAEVDASAPAHEAAPAGAAGADADAEIGADDAPRPRM